MNTKFAFSSRLSKRKNFFVFVILCLVLVFNLSANTSRRGVFAQSPCGDTYIVLPGDTIEGIADLCGTTVEAILSINPEISDPDNLYPGQIIRMPDVESVLETIVAIAPICGLPGTNLLVVGSGFPQNTTIQLGIGQKNLEQNLCLSLEKAVHHFCFPSITHITLY